MGFTVGIEATKRCNFTCDHCFVDAGKVQGEEFSTAELENLIEQIVACGGSTVGWSGGEALLRRDLVEVSEHGARLGLEFGLATNGYLADRERLGVLKRSGVTVVQVSIDGVTDDKAHRYRKGPSRAFERAVQAVRDSAELGLSTWVCSLFSPQTASEIDEMADFSAGLGAVGLRYTLLAPVGRAHGMAYDEEEWRDPAVRAFLETARARSQRGFRVVLDCPTGPFSPGRERFRCGAGHGTSYITAVGDVYPCTALMFPSYLIGNVRETPLVELLFGEKMMQIQREMACSLPGGDCAGCQLIELCRGGCPGRTIAAFGSLRAGAHDGGFPACLLRLHPPTR